jgi:transcription elongation GreA/GreB family factor
MEIDEQLKNIEIIEENDNNKWKVIMWSIVKILDISENEELTYKIVWTRESDILSSEPRISNESLVWKSLLWKKKWDVVKVKAQAWTFEYKILWIN